MEKTGKVWRERIFISKFYMDQSVQVRMDQRKTRRAKTGKVVKECCLSPNLFSLYGGLPYEGSSRKNLETLQYEEK